MSKNIIGNDQDNVELLKAGEYEQFILNFLAKIQPREANEDFLNTEKRLRPVIDNFVTTL